MSLRWRIMGSAVLVVILTVLTSVCVGYYATQSRLDVFVDRIGEDEASQLARSLSGEYSAAGGWETVDSSLARAGYIYGEISHREGSEGRAREPTESPHHDRVRIVITDTNGRVVRDNLSLLPPGTVAPDLDGHRETVFNLTTVQPVGHVYVDVNHEFLSTESHGFLTTLMYITLIAGLLTLISAILLAAWLSRRITAPVTALTEATQAIAQGDTAQLPVRSSDELGRMSAAFNQMTSTLETQRDLRRSLINDVSHELNTPLSVIRLEAAGLRDGLQSPEDASRHIMQEVDRLRGLVTDLDWLAETDRGELKLKLEPASIYELVAQELERWQSQCQERQVTLSLEAPADLADMHLDRTRMNQALGNILSNAILHAEPGGNIVVTAVSDSDRAAVISITDDGIGIDAEDLPHLFDRSYRTKQSRSRGIEGTGLGLAIARAIVESHGGTISVTSGGPGQGTTFAIRFPLNK